MFSEFLGFACQWTNLIGGNFFPIESLAQYEWKHTWMCVLVHVYMHVGLHQNK